MVHRKGLLSQLVAEAVDCWFKYPQEQSIGQKKEKNKEKAVGKESTKKKLRKIDVKNLLSE